MKNIKKLRKLSIFLFTFLAIQLNYSQTIQGDVRDIEGNSITAKILIKERKSSKVISEFVLAKKGKFSYNLKKTYNKNGFFIDVIAVGYVLYSEFVKSTEIKNKMNFNFILSKEKIELLEEVFINANKKPLSIKKDTVVYRVESYKDGTEKKVEDLLKKLPGIKINEETGMIKYKGNTIETVTIEGDNLFDYNYTIGTKNINIDLVKEIEAIENYSENQLLKNIEKSNKVAINLKLKKNKTDLSFSSDIGIGDFIDSNNIPFDLSVNSLAINKKQKSLAITSYNNIGKNASPFNYFENQISLEKIKEEKFFSEKIIPELNLPKVTKNNLSNINSQFFGNLNSIFNFSDKTKAKLNFYYLSDKIKSNQLAKSKINISNSVFNTFDNNFIKKRPRQYRGDFELKFNTSESSLLEYNISFRDESIDTKRDIFSNQDNDFSSSLETNSVFLKQELEYTKKISDRKALQLKIINTANNLEQIFTINPSIFNSTESDQDIQENNSKKQNSSLNAIFLGKTTNNNKYSLSIGYNYSTELLYSNLSSLSNSLNLTVSNSINKLNYNNTEINNRGTYAWNIGDFTISPKYSLRYLSSRFNQENIGDNLKFLIFEPSLTIVYEIDRTSFLSFDTSLSQRPSSLRYLFKNQILIDNRVVKSNEPNLSLQKNKTFNVLFSKNDLFNQFEMYLGANYVLKKGIFLSNLFVDENSSRVNNFFLSESIDNLTFNLSLSKLIYSLRTTFKIKSDYSIANFKNIVNNSELRNTKNHFLENSLFLKTSFNLPVNIENKTTYSLQKAKSVNTFNNSSIENHFKLILKPYRSFSASIDYSYYVPSFKNTSNNYSFLSSTLRYIPKKKPWKLELSGVNLLNEKSFIQESTTDISNNSLSVNLLERYLLLNFSYSF